MIPVFALNNYFYNKEEYDVFSDEELVEKMKHGNEHAEECLYKRYTYVVKRIISSFFLIGGGKEDLFQEAMIGLIKAVNSYDRSLGTKFRTYAEVCIKRQVITAIRKTDAREIIYKSVSLYEFLEFENDCTTFDNYIDADMLNPENVYINEEEKNSCFELSAKILSNFEETVLMEYGQGKSYEEISTSLNKSIKSIDNALQRVKKKICNNKENFILKNG